MLHRVVTAGLLALSAGMALAETPAKNPSNHRVGYSATTVSADSGGPRTVDLDGVVFPVDPAVADNIDLTQVDGSVFYQVAGDTTAVDVGLALRYIDGVVRTTVADYGRSERFDGLLPLAYARLRADLPWSTWYAAAQAKAFGQNRDQVVDANVVLGWESGAGVAIEGGYRHYRLKLVNYDQLDRLDVDLSGPYAMVSLRF